MLLLSKSRGWSAATRKAFPGWQPFPTPCPEAPPLSLVTQRSLHIVVDLRIQADGKLGCSHNLLYDMRKHFSDSLEHFIDDAA